MARLAATSDRTDDSDWARCVPTTARAECRRLGDSTTKPSWPPQLSLASPLEPWRPGDRPDCSFARLLCDSAPPPFAKALPPAPREGPAFPPVALPPLPPVVLVV